MSNRRNVPISYLVRHWRGELSLPVSYFVNGMPLYVALSLLWIAFLFSDSSIAELIALAIATFVIIFWQAVGIFRSASNHVSLGGSNIWAGAAKVMVILSVLVYLPFFAGILAGAVN